MLIKFVTTLYKFKLKIQEDITVEDIKYGINKIHYNS